MENKVTLTQYRTCPLCFSNKGHYLTIVNEIQIFRCQQCSMVFADVEEIKVEKACKYKPSTILKYYQNEPIYTIAYYDMEIDNIIKSFGRSNLKLLEFGCGSGQFLRRARKKGLIVQGIDFSDYSEYANKAFDLNIITSSLDDYHFSENYFDVIYSHATFEHLYQPLQVAKKLTAVLKKGGLFITSGVPNYNTFSIKLFNNFYHNHPPGHINYFEFETITSMYRTLELEKIKALTYGFNFWLYLHKQNAKKNLNTVEYSEEKIIQKLKHEILDLDTLSITYFQRLIANIYSKIRLPKMGTSVSAWGFKQK